MCVDRWPEICVYTSTPEIDNLSVTLSAFAGARRANLLGAIAALLPVIHRLGGEEAVRGTAQAIIDTAKWWP